MTSTADFPAAEGADALEALAILKAQHPFAQCDGCPSRSPHVICLGHGYHADWPCDEALVIGLAEQGLAARPAPAAAPREGEPYLLGYTRALADVLTEAPRGWDSSSVRTLMGVLDELAAAARAGGGDAESPERERACADATKRHMDAHNCLDDDCYATGWRAGSRWCAASGAARLAWGGEGDGCICCSTCHAAPDGTP
jgi:hypothetical protein